MLLAEIATVAAAVIIFHQGISIKKHGVSAKIHIIPLIILGALRVVIYTVMAVIYRKDYFGGSDITYILFAVYGAVIIACAVICRINIKKESSAKSLFIFSLIVGIITLVIGVLMTMLNMICLAVFIIYLLPEHIKSN